jgi:hypothetical protein
VRQRTQPQVAAARAEKGVTLIYLRAQKNHGDPFLCARSFASAQNDGIATYDEDEDVRTGASAHMQLCSAR